MISKAPLSLDASTVWLPLLELFQGRRAQHILRRALLSHSSTALNGRVLPSDDQNLPSHS